MIPAPSLVLRRRGGKKVISAPQGAVINPPRLRVDSTLVKAIARAYRWQRMLEDGTYASAEGIAFAEKISASYINRLLQLTLLSPALVEIILEGRQPATMTTRDVFQPLPALWDEQRHTLLRWVRPARLEFRAGDSRELDLANMALRGINDAH